VLCRAYRKSSSFLDRPSAAMPEPTDEIRNLA
jgi:hypothetical protein